MSRAEPTLRLVQRINANSPAASDDYLMAAAATGSHKAFSELVARHQASLRRFCTCLLGNEGQGQEIAQEVFVQLWTLRNRYEAGGKFKPLLFTMARNRCRSTQRKDRVRRLFALRQPPEPDSYDLELGGNEHDAIVTAALSRLPDRFRVPIVLRYIEGLSYEDIALVIGRTPSTTRSRVFYGLKKLGALLPKDITR